MSDFEALLHKYNQGACTPEEVELVEAWYAQLEVKPARSLTDMQLAQLFLEPEIQPQVKRRVLWPAISVAASVLLAIGICWWTLERNTRIVNKGTIAGQIQPGGNKATLTLSNGQTIVLDKQAEGRLAQQGGVAISIATQGQLHYDATQQQASSAANILRTPKGGMYSVQLPDGSVVWLNAASELRYPVSFQGMNERRVTLSGEAYFEIAADVKHPFKVSTGKQTVTVLGTHFNINAYADEPAEKTSLLEGRVLVADGQHPGQLLVPGQQALAAGNGVAVSTADVNAATGWKDGDFIFNDDIHVIMRQLSRWYNVDVVYKGDISDEHFIASVSRSKSIDQVLKALSLTQRVHFEIDAKTITVMP